MSRSVAGMGTGGGEGGFSPAGQHLQLQLQQRRATETLDHHEVSVLRCVRRRRVYLAATKTDAMAESCSSLRMDTVCGLRETNREVAAARNPRHPKPRNTTNSSALNGSVEAETSYSAPQKASHGGGKRAESPLSPRGQRPAMRRSTGRRDGCQPAHKRGEAPERAEDSTDSLKSFFLEVQHGTWNHDKNE